MARIGLIALFGAGGALTRLGVTNVVGPRSFPWATLLINVTGSFLLGVLVTWGTTRLAHDLSCALAVGFLGAYTTFSTFAVETTLLGDDGRVPTATVYVACSVALGVVAAIAGVALGRSLAQGAVR
jgi:fluoride exporter